MESTITVNAKYNNSKFLIKLRISASTRQETKGQTERLLGAQCSTLRRGICHEGESK